MAYQLWSVVFGEQPSASKWNILGTNDAGFNDGTAIADDAILARHIANLAVSNAQMAADTFLWEKLADVTLGAGADSISSGTFTAKKYLRILAYVIASGGTINMGIRFNNDSGSNYTNRQSANGGADASGTSASSFLYNGAESLVTQVGFLEGINLTATEKLFWGGGHKTTTTGAGTAPTRTEDWVKWANTSVQITRVDVINTLGAGDYAAGSRLLVLGHD
jgi:hypothetical protein